MAIAKKSSRSTKTKAKTAGKKPAVKKRVRKKPTKTKPTAKKTATRKPVKTKTKSTTTKAKKTAKRSTKQKATKSSKSAASEAVVLPTAAGPRLTSKVAALHAFVDALYAPVYRTALVAAAIFLLVGIAALQDTFVASNENQTAVVCTTVNCDIANQTVPPSTIENVSIELLDSVPAIINDNQKFALKIIGANTVSAYVVPGSTGNDVMIPIQQLSEQNYQVEVRPRDLEADNYRINIVAVSSAGVSRELLSSSFQIPAEEVAVQNTTVTAAKDTVIGIEDIADSVLEADETEPSTPVEIETVNSELADNSVSSSEANVTAAEPEIDTIAPETAVEATEKLSKDDTSSNLTTAFNPEKNTYSVLLDAEKEFSSVLLYARPVAALQSQYLGQMTKVSTSWIYALPADRLPNGTYEIFTVARQPNAAIEESNTVRLVIENMSTAAPTNAESEIVAVPEPRTTTTEPAIIPIREFASLSPADNDGASLNNEVADQVEPNRATDVLATNRELITDLMQRYAVARQGNDQLLIAAANDEIEAARKSIIRDAIAEGDGTSLRSLDTALQNNFSDLKKRIDVFEDIRQSRSGDDVRLDTDGDGVADYDETLIYGTNPELADTDQDGFIDGVEIIRGYNPLDATPEAVVEYQLPTNTIGLERDDVLLVSSVSPVVVIDEEAGTTRVLAEVRGTGLPNSYVTLYIFSTPTIVTVKTDDDGSFVYRFDKELIDGSHEVYVAFTDNTGAVLAQSRPFQFIKEAEAFTPVGSEAVPVTPATIVEESTVSSVQLVLGMSIIMLGLFLLMLGIHLKHTPKLEKTKPA